MFAQSLAVLITMIDHVLIVFILLLIMVVNWYSCLFSMFYHNHDVDYGLAVPIANYHVDYGPAMPIAMEHGRPCL